jgi:hypothetical protein
MFFLVESMDAGDSQSVDNILITCKDVVHCSFPISPVGAHSTS